MMIGKTLLARNRVVFSKSICSSYTLGRHVATSTPAMSKKKKHTKEDNSLLLNKGYIDGAWVDAHSKRTFAVVDPSDKLPFIEVPDMNETDTRKAITAASKSMEGWRKTTAKTKSKILRELYSLMITKQEELARLITKEQGKSLSEARSEVIYAASYIEWYSEEVKRTYGLTIPSPMPDKRMHTIKVPVGVCALITPWNFPIAMGARKVGAALAAGCTVVLKPSEDTPLSSLAFAKLASRAGVPPGVINVVTCSRDSVAKVGAEICASNRVRKISFTGSTNVGKLLMAKSANTVKRVSLELGGNAPFIVFDDADIEEAVQGCIASKFRNSGQTCVAANRILVQDAIYDKFTQRFVQAVKQLSVGNGMDEGTNQGPLINDQAMQKQALFTEDAVAKGASVAIGGGTIKSPSLIGHFYEPTVLTNCKSNMMLYTHEIFGPIAPLYRFHTEAEAVQMANDSRSGLAGYFYTQDSKRITRLIESLEVGMVGVNAGVISSEVAPFGGVKESGIGREGSVHGIDDYMEIKYACVQC